MCRMNGRERSQAVGIILCALGSFLSGVTARAITVQELQAALAASVERITLIDVRETSEYTKAHIPGAINIPASICGEKKLPPLGTVVVYGSGLLKDPVADAAAALAAKPGLEVDVLEGGYAGWLEGKGPSTEAAGLKQVETHLVSYADLKSSDMDRVVLVDLRAQAPRTRQGAETSAEPAAKVTDLSEAFPGARITRSPERLPRARQADGPDNVGPVLVLIDNGDGRAEQLAKQLKASGRHRVVVLAGGEEILARGGRAGLQRQGQPLGVITGEGLPVNRR